MKKTSSRIPVFKNEDEERQFWATHSPLDYFDTAKAWRASFPSLKPSVRSISIRLPEGMLAELKALANKKAVGYQSLAKVYLAREIALERHSLGGGHVKLDRQKRAQRARSTKVAGHRG